MVLSWSRARVIVRRVSGCSVPGFQSFSDTVISCVNDRGVIKVNAMIIRPRVVRNVRAFGFFITLFYPSKTAVCRIIILDYNFRILKIISDHLVRHRNLVSSARGT